MTVSATVIADSVAPNGARITTMQVCCHRLILAEVNTHRKFTRNWRSSRAVPVHKLLTEVRNNPAMPVYWGKNQPGMQASEELTGEELWMVKAKWREAARNAADTAEYMALMMDLHKQTANRILEPFLYVHGVITSTEWQNFFGLRLHKDAQPEMRALAVAMYDAYKSSKPRQVVAGDWHLPYIRDEDYQAAVYFRQKHSPITNIYTYLIRQSVARCARVSYKPFDGDSPSSIEEDLALYDKLVGSQPMHASPAEHQATPSAENTQSELTGNFTGWLQYRKTLSGEDKAPLPEGYSM